MPASYLSHSHNITSPLSPRALDKNRPRSPFTEADKVQILYFDYPELYSPLLSNILVPNHTTR